ncbi:MAG: EamA family transporter [Sneathiella sp.]|uniref:EamA family transporter n=1 Tax=Sneathiella sp. TaxID=1964365 RepID=UPI003001E64F
MEPNIVLLVLVSAFLHPLWNLLIKKSSDPQFAFMFLTFTISACGLIHGLIVGVDFFAVLDVLPLIAISVFGQLLYGNGLTATLKRGDLSMYYPIIRASPVVVVAISVVFLGKSYPLVILLGILLVVCGVFLILYRRGSNFLDNPSALGFALLALMGTGLYSLSDAEMMKSISPQALIFVIDGVIAPIYALQWYRSRQAGSAAPRERLSVSTLWSVNTLWLLVPGGICYASYFLILLAYQLGGDVAAVTALRQASILISVALGGMFLREGAILRRFAAAAIIVAGIVVIALN